MNAPIRTGIVAILTLVTLVSASLAGDVSKPAAKRIVAIGGSITEIIYALGEQERLIARDTTSTYPVEAEALPDVGYIRALSPEGVLSVNPDLILALEGSGPPEAVSVLREAKVPIVLVPEAYDADGVIAKIESVAAAIGATEKAEKLVDQISSDLAVAASKSGETGGDKKVLFILSTRGGKIMASGTGTSADGIIRLAGGRNAITEFPGFKQISDEAVIEAAPDVILMMDRGGDHSIADEELFSHAAIVSTPAAASKSVVRMNGLYLLGFGPRTADAVRELSEALYGEPG